MSIQHPIPGFSSRDCGDCPVRNRAVCARSEEDELILLEKMKYYRSFSAGQTILFAGDRMEFVGSVVKGIATLARGMEDGRTQMVGMLLPSDFVGRPGRERAPYDVVAATDLVLCCFHRKPFESLIGSKPNISGRLLEMTLDELDAAREWMLLLGRKTAREKLASLLAIFARREAALISGTARVASGALPRGLAFDLPLTREAMADYLGLTLETVSRQVSSLRKDGLIRLEGLRRVILPDPAALIAETGDD